MCPSIGAADAHTVNQADVGIVNATAGRRCEIDDAVPPSFFAKRGFAFVDCHPDSRLSLRPGLASLWCPLRGEVLFTAAECKAVLVRRSIYASDSQRRLMVCPGSASRCVGVVATQDAWSRLLEPWQAVAGRECAVFPGVHAASRSVQRHVLALLREVHADGAQWDRHGGMSLLAFILNELQVGFQPCIDRCPGHSLAKRRAVFVRLQRARNHIAHGPGRDFNVGKLALLANYSIWRFIKVFCRVYGETPYACVSRSRAERARRLLRDSDLAVGDVGSAAGFDSRASFTRVIKRQLGQPARAIRRAARMDAAL